MKIRLKEIKPPIKHFIIHYTRDGKEHKWYTTSDLKWCIENTIVRDGGVIKEVEELKEVYVLEIQGTGSVFKSCGDLEMLNDMIQRVQEWEGYKIKQVYHYKL